MLEALMSGEALAAGELARAAGITAATASEHLARLRDGGLVEAVAQGRHRYYRLTGPEVAHALEAISLLDRAKPPPPRTLRAVREDAAMRRARTCYDHLAGELGVALHDALLARGALSAEYVLQPAGVALLDELGVDLATAQAARRHFARPCLDWTQRRPHLAGALAAALCARLMELGWLVRRVPGQRSLRLTDPGQRGLATVFGI
jgi:biotin operon repressor